MIFLQRHDSEGGLVLNISSIILRVVTLVINNLPLLTATRHAVRTFPHLGFKVHIIIFTSTHKLGFNHIQDPIGKVIKHFCQPFCTLRACRGEIHFNEPWVEVAVQQEIETIDFEAVRSMVQRGVLG